jgi:IS30 family transposase
LNREEFITLSPERRVEEVNHLLKKHTLREIAATLNFAYSTFTTEIRNNGEYQYNKKSKQYVKANVVGDKKEVNSETITFIDENKVILQRLIEMYQSNNLLLLDERVYSKNAKFENKSIKMNKDIYKEFSLFCDTHYNHLKLQDLISQAILDFTERYKR